MDRSRISLGSHDQAAQQKKRSHSIDSKHSYSSKKSLRTYKKVGQDYEIEMGDLTLH